MYREPSDADLLALIDKLDELVHNAKGVPLTNEIRIDRDEIYDILDQIRATTEVTQGKTPSEERETESEQDAWRDDKSIWDE